MTIIQPSNPFEIESLTLINGLNCEAETGSIGLELKGGTPPYDFEWNNGGVDNTINNLSAGTYQCSIIDHVGCTFISPIYTIEELSDFQLNTISTPSVDNMNNGTATVEVVGGVWPFTFIWDAATGNQQDSIALNLPSGEYEVLVIDGQGCEFFTIVEVDMLTAVEKIEETTFQIFPNPTPDKIFISNVDLNLRNFSVEIFSIEGKSLYTISNLPETANIPIFNFENYPSGVYLIKTTFNQNEVQISRVIVNR